MDLKTRDTVQVKRRVLYTLLEMVQSSMSNDGCSNILGSIRDSLSCDSVRYWVSLKRQEQDLRAQKAGAERHLREIKQKLDKVQKELEWW